MIILRDGILKLEFALLVLFAIVMVFKRVKVGRLLFNLSFGLYLSVIIAYCFFPIQIRGSGVLEGFENNFIPFKSIIADISDSFKTHTPYGLISVFGNLVMLTPLGLFFYYYIKDLKFRLVGVALFSLSIEVIQYIIGLLIGYNYRCIDIDDFILNAVGGVFACILFNLLINKYNEKRRV